MAAAAQVVTATVPPTDDEDQLRGMCAARDLNLDQALLLPPRKAPRPESAATTVRHALSSSGSYSQVLLPSSQSSSSQTSEWPPSSSVAVAAAIAHGLGHPYTTSRCVDRHACVAAPYAPNEPRTARYFELMISKTKAPVVCGYAGKMKGKAIYADRDIAGATRIWTESPFVAMQHARNKHQIPCCQYCFVPLLGSYHALWSELVSKWHRIAQSSSTVEGKGPCDPLRSQDDDCRGYPRELVDAMRQVDEGDLEHAINALDLSRPNCGLATPTHVCTCGEVYCSRLCQVRAYHEFHAILCPRRDAFNAMHEFQRHVDATNEIFYLAAKVIARILSRYVATRDFEKAREPIDMFYKKPWWEVVMLDKHVAAMQREQRVHMGATEREEAAAHSFRDLLTTTHELLLDALECNLVHLEREDQLQGCSVASIWSTCASVLSFEFFAALLGLFEMNNISMEIDHPFHALVDILEPDGVSHNRPPEKDVRATTSPKTSEEDREADDSVVPGADPWTQDPIVERVRRLLEFEDQQLREQQSGHAGGFQSIDGTALFPIICTMNHSCDPNCTVLYTKDGDAHVVAVRDIRKGEELCICYIDIDQDVQQREAELREYQFKCLCDRCTSERQFHISRENACAGGQEEGRVDVRRSSHPLPSILEEETHADGGSDDGQMNAQSIV